VAVMLLELSASLAPGQIGVAARTAVTCDRGLCRVLGILASHVIAGIALG
jgi:hypothetical protein